MSRMFEKKFSLIFLLVAVLFLAVMVTVSTKLPVSQKSFDFAPDFSWVKGKLEFNPIEGGFWQIRFGEETAPYGGKFVLGQDPKLNQFQEGDLVLIKGQIAKEQISIYMAGWLYEIEEAKLLR